MRNILLWVGITALALQDYFKKQTVKTTRQQQFLQTGETSQAFIEGTYAVQRKKISYYFGKPKKIKKIEGRWSQEYQDLIPRLITFYRWKVKDYILDLTEIQRDYSILFFRNSDESLQDIYYLYYDLDEDALSELTKSLFHNLGANYKRNSYESDSYQKLYDIANAGDWELALQIAKGQNLL